MAAAVHAAAAAAAHIIPHSAASARLNPGCDSEKRRQYNLSELLILTDASAAKLSQRLIVHTLFQVGNTEPPVSSL